MNATVADAMVRAPKTHGATATVADARETFRDEHVHAVLVVADGRLLGVVEREDLDGAAGQDVLADHGRLAGRSVGPDVDLDVALHHMRRHRRRRLAVIDDGDRLLGLLCLKRTGTGFCSDADVSARSRPGPARDPHADGSGPGGSRPLRNGSGGVLGVQAPYDPARSTRTE